MKLLKFFIVFAVFLGTFYLTIFKFDGWVIDSIISCLPHSQWDWFVLRWILWIVLVLITLKIALVLSAITTAFALTLLGVEPTKKPKP